MYLVPDLFTLEDEQPGTRIVYAPLLGLVVRVNVEMASLIERLHQFPDGELPCGGEGVESLIDLGVLSARPYASLLPRREAQYIPTSVSLFLTSACSLACTYCHSSANDSRLTMTWPMAKSAIDLVVSNAIQRGKDSVGVTLHGGGEPTVCFDLLQRTLLYVRELASKHGIVARASIGTNGFTSSERAAWLAENADEATLSIDGLRDDHDQYRRGANGQPSYDQVMATARVFDSKNFRYGVRMTIARSWVHRLPEAVDSLCSTLGVGTIQAEPVFPAGRARCVDNLSPTPSDFIAAFRRARVNATRRGRRLKFSGARLGLVTDCFCNAVGHSFAVMPTGKVSCCYEITTEGDGTQDYIWGHFDSSSSRYVLDEGRRLAQSRWSVHEQPGCDGCFCKWTCAGDCPAKRSAADPPERPRCIITKALTYDQIVSAARRGKNITRPCSVMEGI